MSRWVERAVLAIAFSGVGAFLWELAIYGSQRSNASAVKLSYADLVVITLTALAVMLAAVTLFLAIAAVVGWTAFESQVAKSATNYLDKQFGDGGLRYNALAAEITKRVVDQTYSGISSLAPITRENSSDTDEVVS